MAHSKKRKLEDSSIGDLEGLVEDLRSEVDELKLRVDELTRLAVHLADALVRKVELDPHDEREIEKLAKAAEDDL